MKLKIFRNLSCPIGAQNKECIIKCKKQFFELKKMYEEELTDEEPFIFGSHYSVSGHIIGFLIRLEPYTTMHLEF